jgi:hypothetical protein
VADELEISEFEKFKWNVLGDAAFEDCYGVWEPLFALRGCYAIEGQTESDRQAFAERALRELFDAGFIYFFRVPPGHGVNEASDDEDLRLRPAEVDAALGGDWWHGREAWPQGRPQIWFFSTPAGQAACENPPEHIRELWRLDEPR